MTSVLFLFSVRLGHIAASLAALHLRLAVHRGSEDRAGDRVLHSIHRDESLRHLHHSHRRLLRSRLRYDDLVLADMEGDEETAEGTAELAGREARREQAQQLEVVTNAFNCLKPPNLSSQHVTQNETETPAQERERERDGNALPPEDRPRGSRCQVG